MKYAIAIEIVSLAAVVLLTSAAIAETVKVEGGRAAAAAADFQVIIEHRGVAPLSPNWALAYLGLARAHALAGDIAGSRSAYRHFLGL